MDAWRWTSKEIHLLFCSMGSYLEPMSSIQSCSLVVRMINYSNVIIVFGSFICIENYSNVKLP